MYIENRMNYLHIKIFCARYLQSNFVAFTARIAALFGTVSGESNRYFWRFITINPVLCISRIRRCTFHENNTSMKRLYILQFHSSLRSRGQESHPFHEVEPILFQVVKLYETTVFG